MGRGDLARKYNCCRIPHTRVSYARFSQFVVYSSEQITTATECSTIVRFTCFYGLRTACLVVTEKTPPPASVVVTHTREEDRARDCPPRREHICPSWTEELCVI